MFDVNDDAKGAYRRIEGSSPAVVTEETARIVEETLLTSARVTLGGALGPLRYRLRRAPNAPHSNPPRHEGPAL